MSDTGIYIIAIGLFFCGMACATIFVALIVARPNPPRCSVCHGRIVVNDDDDTFVCEHCGTPFAL